MSEPEPPSTPDVPPPPPAMPPPPASGLDLGRTSPRRPPTWRRRLGFALLGLVAVVYLVLRFVPQSPTGVILSDRLSSAKHAWIVQDSDTVATGYVDGGYHILIRPAEHSFSSVLYFKNRRWDDVTVAVDAKPRSAGEAASDFGVTCWVASHTEYRFLIDPSGHTYVIYRDQGGTGSRLASGVIPSDDLHAAGPDRVEGRCQRSDTGTYLSLSVNGALVGSQNDPDSLGHFEGLALHVSSSSGMSDVLFTNALLRAN